MKKANIRDASQINKSEIYTLKSMYFGDTGANGPKTLGYVYINLNFNQFNILHKFHVVADSFGSGMPQNGILGREFFFKYCSFNKVNDEDLMLRVQHEDFEENVKILIRTCDDDGVARILTFDIAKRHQ